MKRKIIIVVLTLAAVMTTGIAVTSYFHPFEFRNLADRDGSIRDLHATGLFLRDGIIVHEHVREDRVRRGLCDRAYRIQSMLWKRFPRLARFLQIGRRVGYLGGRSYPLADSGEIVWSYGYALPLGIPSLLFAVYTAAAFIRGPLRRRRRRRKGLCESCGYNLTGNESGVCPECARRLEET
ncbi:MAG: hypothetical protein JSU63_07230 [Phycisphaerales bacterium]|nr:MAG: hypothetical protein JSU63_07230 [Phycisphaerales bacterium]